MAPEKIEAYEDAKDMLYRKIDIMETRKFPEYSLAIRIVQDVIREIDETIKKDEQKGLD